MYNIKTQNINIHKISLNSAHKTKSPNTQFFFFFAISERKFYTVYAIPVLTNTNTKKKRFKKLMLPYTQTLQMSVKCLLFPINFCCLQWPETFN